VWPCGASLAPVCAHCGRDFPRKPARFSAAGAVSRERQTARAGRGAGRAQAGDRSLFRRRPAGSTARIAGLDAEGAMNFPASDRDDHGACGPPLRTARWLSYLGRWASRPAFRGAARPRGPCGCSPAMPRSPCAAPSAALPDAPIIRVGLHSGEVVFRKALTPARRSNRMRTGFHRASGQPDRAGKPRPARFCLSRDSQDPAPGRIAITEPLGLRSLKRYHRSG